MRVVARRFVTCALLAGAGIAGCGRGGPEAPGRPVVALVMKSLANEFFQTMEQGARTHQAAHSEQYELVAAGIKDEQDVARQIAIVDQMIARRVNAIVLAPADSKALVGVAKKAVDAGIVVVNIDNRFDRDALADRQLSVPFVGPDNRKGAAAVGAYVAKRLKGGDPIAILEGAPNAFNGIERKRGFEDAANAAGLVIARSQTAQWETARANQIVSALVSERADIKAILCANDSMALGAVAALKAAGRGRDVLVAGFDNITAVQGLIKSGEIVATADQHGDQLAVFGIQFALERLRNPSAPLADRETPVDLITAETLH
ncbi:MAG TPA: substrate-binding domain-containing protein [Vicinamibacterales bacterium]|nr:substrate-binding domain-containing protein [Vicinamibacterales bacterium]